VTFAIFAMFLMVAAEYFNQVFNLVMQVCSNKEQISCLERAVRGAKDSEERGRECLAMDKLVERAYTRRMVIFPSFCET
jgi:hypothetical protein